MPILHWLNDEEARSTSSRLPYRLLEADPALSYGDAETANMLIQGDNLDALKALLPYYAGQVKCIYIDPPYNTQSAFEHYDDNLEHSIWLSTMYPRIEILRELLAEDGSIWVSIDDREAHYLKLVMDEVYGRRNFITTVVWEKTTSARNDAQLFSSAHEHILVFAKNISLFSPNRLERTETSNSAYKNPDNDPRGPWREIDYKCAKTADERPNLYYPIKHPFNGQDVWPRRTRVWAYGQEEHRRHIQEDLLWWGKTGNYSLPKLKKFLVDAADGLVPQTLWFASDVDQTRTAKKEMKDLFPDDPFATPKPERLLQRIIHLSTQIGDLVLDSFLGSGTTAAVAHKMGRRYIGIEMGNHAVTHCVPRLRKVIDGEQGGISKEVGWQGGGGFTFYRLGEPVFDETGQINPNVKFHALAAHVWFSETHTPLLSTPTTPLLGVQGETALYLLYNGILGDKTPDGGNVLTARVLRDLPTHPGKKIIYGEMCLLDEATLQQQAITFKHIPYDIKAR